MKKIYLVLSAVAISFGSYAQLSLTKAANEPVAGDSKNVKGFDSLGVVPKNTGTGLTWNFSSFVQTTLNATSTYSAAASVPSSSLFPGCTVVENTPSGDKNFWKAASTPSTQFEMLGINNSLGVEFNFNTDPLVMVVWPATMGYSLTDVGTGSISAFSNTGTLASTLTMVGSGTGSVILPGNVTYTNILQTKMTQTLYAVVPALGYTISVLSSGYSYYSGTQKFPLVSVNYEKTTLSSILGPTVTNTSKIEMNANVITVGINEVNFDASFTMFPNPAKDNFSVNLSNTTNDKGTIEIYNELGQIAKRVELGNESVIKTNVSVADLKPGLYMVKTSIGSRSSSRKLIVQ
jgi:hypothetical protein